MIYIAYNYDGYMLDICMAVSEQMAVAYWQGKGVIPHSQRCIDATALANHPTGVLPILTTKEVDGYALQNRSREAKYILVTKS
jgi:hypothetical protein